MSPPSRRKESERRKAAGDDLSSIQASKPHLVHQLVPCDHWRLVIDEGGDGWGDHGRYDGRVVGVLVPKTSQIPGRAWHTRDEADLNKIDKVLQQILDEENVGILGLSAQAAGPVPGVVWANTVLNVLDCIFHLMPIEKGRVTRIDIGIERFRDFEPADLYFAAEHLKNSLVKANPDRFGQLKLSVKVYGKATKKALGKDRRIGLIAYADVIAHTWAGTGADAKARLRQSNLLGQAGRKKHRFMEACLHDGSPKVLRRAWRVWGDHEIAADLWDELVQSPELKSPTSLVRTLMDRLGASVRLDVRLWRKYLHAAHEHLESKAVDVHRVDRHIEWLREFMPDGTSLPPALDMLWHSSQLERSNHLGGADEVLSSKLDDLKGQVWEEFPALVCQADLVRAVEAMNRLAFEEAEKILDPWRDMEAPTPPLRHRGRVLSSLGQISAFRGQWAEAHELFECALSCFARLSDPHAVEAEQRQTGVYQAIAFLDDPQLGAKDRRERLARRLDLTRDGIAEMAVSADRRQQHAHHLLLRYLVHGAPEADVVAYVESDWGKSHAGHPWILIDAYRGALRRVHDAEMAQSLATKAVEKALDEKQGATVRLIGAAIDLGTLSWGRSPIVDAKVIDELHDSLPYAAARIALLRAAMDAPPADFVTFLTAVLPFNFR